MMSYSYSKRKLARRIERLGGVYSLCQKVTPVQIISAAEAHLVLTLRMYIQFRGLPAEGIGDRQLRLAELMLSKSLERGTGLINVSSCGHSVKGGRS
jgi:hypothetical protein